MCTSCIICTENNLRDVGVAFYRKVHIVLVQLFASCIDLRIILTGSPPVKFGSEAEIL